MTAAAKRGRGRPVKAPQPGTNVIGTRIPGPLKAAIVEAANAAHRSIGAEIALRLQRSFCDIDRADKLQVGLRLPRWIRDEVKAAAAAHGRSLNAEIVARLENSITIERLIRDEGLAGLGIDPIDDKDGAA